MKAEDIDPDQILKKLSTEDFATYDKRSLLEKLFEILKPKISEILKIYKTSGDSYLYRGMRDKPAAFIYKPREDRKPLDTDPKIHQFFNLILDKITGGKVNRSNATFAVADYDSANFYGNVYIIFPFNGFDYVFSEDIRDLYNYYNDTFLERHYYGKDSYKSYPLIKYYVYDRYGGMKYKIRLLMKKSEASLEDLMQSLLEYFGESGFKSDERILDFAKNKNTPLIHVIKDLLIDYFRTTKKTEDEKIEKILDKFTIDFIDHESVRKEFISEIEDKFFFNKKLTLALQTDKEIMIRADKILALDYYYFHDDIHDIIHEQ